MLNTLKIDKSRDPNLSWAVKILPRNVKVRNQYSGI